MEGYRLAKAVERAFPFFVVPSKGFLKLAKGSLTSVSPANTATPLATMLGLSQHLSQRTAASYKNMEIILKTDSIFTKRRETLVDNATPRRTNQRQNQNTGKKNQ